MREDKQHKKTHHSMGKVTNTHTYTQKGRIRTFTFLLVPHCQHSEYEGTEGGSKEAPPVVPHRKKR